MKKVLVAIIGLFVLPTFASDFCLDPKATWVYNSTTYSLIDPNGQERQCKYNLERYDLKIDCQGIMIWKVNCKSLFCEEDMSTLMLIDRNNKQWIMQEVFQSLSYKEYESKLSNSHASNPRAYPDRLFLLKPGGGITCKDNNKTGTIRTQYHVGSTHAVTLIKKVFYKYYEPDPNNNPVF